MQPSSLLRFGNYRKWERINNKGSKQPLIEWNYKPGHAAVFFIRCDQIISHMHSDFSHLHFLFLYDEFPHSHLKKKQYDMQKRHKDVSKKCFLYLRNRGACYKILCGFRRLQRDRKNKSGLLKLL